MFLSSQFISGKKLHSATWNNNWTPLVTSSFGHSFWRKDGSGLVWTQYTIGLYMKHELAPAGTTFLRPFHPFQWHTRIPSEISYISRSYRLATNDFIHHNHPVLIKFLSQSSVTHQLAVTHHGKTQKGKANDTAQHDQVSDATEKDIDPIE